MLTLLTVPKPFVGHIDVIQRNAIASWRRLGEDVDILLCGDEVGTREVAASYGGQHVTGIRCNEHGTPYFDSVFELAARRARHDLLCYINTDIILLPDFRATLARLDTSGLFIVGRRTDLDVTTSINFDHHEWAVELADFARSAGKVRGPNWVDYFVFPRRAELFEWPPLLVGRGVWDNWFVTRARDIGLRLVDATPSITAIHQNHDYTHVKASRGGAWEGPEGDWNRQVAGTASRLGAITDATGVIWRGRVWPALACQYVERRWQRWRRGSQGGARMGDSATQTQQA